MFQQIFFKIYYRKSDEAEQNPEFGYIDGECMDAWLYQVYQWLTFFFSYIDMIIMNCTEQGQHT